MKIGTEKEKEKEKEKETKNRLEHIAFSDYESQGDLEYTKLLQKLKEIIFLTEKISEKYLIKKLIKENSFREKDFLEKEFYQQLKVKDNFQLKDNFLESCLQLMSSNNNGEKVEDKIRHIFLFSGIETITSGSCQDCLFHYVTTYLSKESGVTFEDRDSFHHLIFQQASSLGKFDDRLIQSFEKTNSFHSLLADQFSRDPNFMLQKDGYVFKLLFLDKFITPQDFVEYRYLGFENSRELLHPIDEDDKKKKDGKHRGERVIHNLVALGGQEVVEKLKLLFCAENIDEKQENEEKKLQDLFADDLVYYQNLLEEFILKFISLTKLPRDICKIIINF
jgi:hypothetical protein